MIVVPLEGKLPKEVPIDSGIYRLVLTFEGVTKFYIGQSINIRKRIKEHRYQIRRGLHDNSWIQKTSSLNRNLIVEILELAEYEQLTCREQHFIDCADKDELVNTRLTASAPPIGTRDRVTKHQRQPVVGIRIETLEVVCYDSMRGADEDGFNSSLINRCVRGHLSQHKGLVWVTSNTFKRHSNRILTRVKEMSVHRFSSGVYRRRILGYSDTDTVVFESTSQLTEYGFDRRAVYRILDTDKKHKGFKFRELKEDVSDS